MPLSYVCHSVILLSTYSLQTHREVLVGFTIRWLIQLHDLVSHKATSYLVVVTNSDSCNDLCNATI